jgi:hypothetical protein
VSRGIGLVIIISEAPSMLVIATQIAYWIPPLRCALTGCARAGPGG